MKRAALMVSNKGTQKVSKTIERGDAAPPDGFVERVLMSLVMDISLLEKSVTRVKVQVMAIAKEHGIDPPKE